MSVFKIKYLSVPNGGHVYCRLFAAESQNATYAGCGNFTIRKSEFGALQKAMSGVSFEKEGDASQQ